METKPIINSLCFCLSLTLCHVASLIIYIFFLSVLGVFAFFFLNQSVHCFLILNLQKQSTV